MNRSSSSSRLCHGLGSF